VKTLISEFLVDEYEDTYAIIGFDTKGNPDDQTMEVFHAMRCRESFRKKYDIKGEEHAAYDQ